MEILTEIYQFLFISSIIYILYILIDLSVKVYGRFVLKTDARFKIGLFGKITLWASIAIVLTYIL